MENLYDIRTIEELEKYLESAKYDLLGAESRFRIAKQDLEAREKDVDILTRRLEEAKKKVVRSGKNGGEER